MLCDLIRTGYHLPPVRNSSSHAIIVVAPMSLHSFSTAPSAVFVSLALPACLHACQRPIQTAGRVSVVHAGQVQRVHLRETFHRPVGVAGPGERSGYWTARLLVLRVTRTARFARACVSKDRGIGRTPVMRAIARRGLVTWSWQL